MKTVEVIIDDTVSRINLEDRDIKTFLKVINAFNIQTENKRVVPLKEIQPNGNSMDTDEILNSCYPNAYFKEIYNFLLDNFTISKVEPKKSMVGFFTFSSTDNVKSELGLAWLYYPNDGTSFNLYLRNTKHIEYPENLTQKLINFRENNRGFPIFSIKNKSDVEITKELIRFAYENY